MRPSRIQLRLVILTLALLAALPAAFAVANHAWAKYHWERTSTDPVTVGLGNNVTGSWGSALSGASSDWSLNTVTTHIQTDVVSGAGKADCGAVSGRVEVCNAEYGDNGWLGIASIWVTRGKNTHITQGTVQVNDTYFNTPTYDSAVWRQLVMCQEVGHTLGLDHQDENFYNAPLGTCMDYTATPTEADAHPNAHDYEQLASIYSHIDGSGPGGGPKPGPRGNGGANFVGNTALPAQATRADGDVFSRQLPDGRVVITFVTWMPE